MIESVSGFNQEIYGSDCIDVSLTPVTVAPPND